jgi:hypothetical protein
MDSPILDLEHAIAGAAFGIAPERALELAEDERTDKFHLVWSDRPGFDIGVVVQTQQATLPIAALEYLWCCAYLFWVLYQEYVEAQRSSNSGLDLAQSPRATNAINLLNWASRNMAQPGVQPWPDGSAHPMRNPEYASDAHVANELFLCAIAWIIHHELGHVRKRHNRADALFPLKKEQEADFEATDWVMCRSSVSLETQKRQLGIVTALMAIQFLDKPTRGDSYVRSHPLSIERLDYCLDRAEVGDDSVVCAFAAVALQFQLGQLDIPVDLDGASIRDVLRGLQAAFVQHGRRATT